MQAAVDLHTHSTASDGTKSPLELVREAEAIGLGALAITDHDTMAGVLEVLDAGFSFDINFLTGLEISARPPDDFNRGDELHILGYGMDPGDPGIAVLLDRLQDARRTRNPLMIRRLQAMGMDISLDEVAAKAHGGLVGRPHMAKVLMEKGLVSDMDTAFMRYLGKGCPAYIEKYREPWEDAIAAIRRAGGIAVLAHPGLIPGIGSRGLRLLLGMMKEAGLGGVETYYPKHDAQMVSTLKGLASELDLLLTGGSDYHGDFKDDISIGTGAGDLFVPYGVYTELLNRLEKG